MIATLIGMLVDDAGGELLVGHLEAAVAVDRPHDPVRLGHLGAHRGGHGVAHRAQAAGVQPGVGAVVLDELRRPHLVLADARDVRRLRPGDRADPLDDVLRGHVPGLGLGVAERVRRTQPIHLGDPLGVVARRRRRRRACSAPRSASAMTSRQSPTIGTSASRFLPISAGSMSAWMTLASGAKVASFPVTRSSKRAPSAIEQVGAAAARSPRRPSRACPACRGAAGGRRARRRGP